MTKSQQTRSIVELIDVMARLRTPDGGCPWDLEQTFETIAPYTIEEAYEVADAIQRGDLVDLKEELGDLLLQVVYHARMAQEADAFDFSDVVGAIVDKMVRRHPHVFGTPEERAAGVTEGFWERIKAEEKAQKAQERIALGKTKATNELSLLDDVPVGLPALVRAIKLQSKAARVGFDWPSVGPVVDKLKEELAELDSSLTAGDQTMIEEEFGDLLFAMANVARHLNIDAEAALHGANHKFRQRFGYVEEALRKDGRGPEASTLEEMDSLWDEAKALEVRK